MKAGKSRGCWNLEDLEMMGKLRFRDLVCRWKIEKCIKVGISGFREADGSRKGVQTLRNLESEKLRGNRKVEQRRTEWRWKSFSNA